MSIVYEDSTTFSRQKQRIFILFSKHKSKNLIDNIPNKALILKIGRTMVPQPCPTHVFCTMLPHLPTSLNSIFMCIQRNLVEAFFFVYIYKLWLPENSQKNSYQFEDLGKFYNFYMLGQKSKNKIKYIYIYI